jgi:hypothetical protein
MVSFTALLLSPWEKSLHYPLHWRLNGPWSWPKCCGKEKISCPCQELNPSSSAIQPISHLDTNSAIPAPIRGTSILLKLCRGYDEWDVLLSWGVGKIIRECIFWNNLQYDLYSFGLLC